jgi:protein involved in polysaccharide export with SLBB domain
METLGAVNIKAPSGPAQGGTESNQQRAPGKIYVLGQVKQSGPIEVPADEVFTVSKAILKAGGFSDLADKRKVRLIRGGISSDATDQNTLIMNVADVWEKGKTANDFPVKADDMIFVPKGTQRF